MSLEPCMLPFFGGTPCTYEHDRFFSEFPLKFEADLFMKLRELSLLSKYVAQLLKLFLVIMPWVGSGLTLQTEHQRWIKSIII